MARKIKTKYPGVRYREHPTRKHNGLPDRYFTIRYMVNGKEREDGVGWSSEGMNPERANKIRADLRTAQREGRGPQTLAEQRKVKNQAEQAKKSERRSFRSLADEFIDWAKVNKKTWAWDERRLRNHVLPILGDVRINEMAAVHIERLKVMVQEKGLAPATVNHCLQLVRAIYNFAARLGHYAGQNPTKNVRFVKHDNKRVRFLSYQEAEHLLNAIKKRSQDWHDICLLSLFAGLRFGEITALTWADVDLEHRVLNILDPKSGESRTAFVTDRLKGMLELRSETASSRLVFPGRFGEKIEKVSHTFTRTVEDLGYNIEIDDPRQKVVFHTLRHTFASWLAMQGTPILEIKELLGHKTIEMTMRYAHLIPDQKRKAVETLEARMSAKVIPIRKKAKGEA